MFLVISHSTNRWSLVPDIRLQRVHFGSIFTLHFKSLSAVSNLLCSCSHRVKTTFALAAFLNINPFHGTLGRSPIRWRYVFLIILFFSDRAYWNIRRCMNSSIKNLSNHPTSLCRYSHVLYILSLYVIAV